MQQYSIPYLETYIAQNRQTWPSTWDPRTMIPMSINFIYITNTFAPDKVTGQVTCVMPRFVPSQHTLYYMMQLRGLSVACKVQLSPYQAQCLGLGRPTMPVPRPVVFEDAEWLAGP